MNYQTVAQKVSEFITFKAQIDKMRQEVAELESNPPKIDLEKEVLSWEEAVEFAESEKLYAEKLKTLRMGIGNREDLIYNKEAEIGEMLPIKNHYIQFKITMDGKEEAYKIGYFPGSYGFRMEKMELGFKLKFDLLIYFIIFQ